MKVVASSSKSTNNVKEFVIIDIVVGFGQEEQLWEIEARILFTIGICLKNNSIKGIFENVGSRSNGC